MKGLSLWPEGKNFSAYAVSCGELTNAAFYLKPVKDSHVTTVYLLQYGNEPEPAYSLRYPDPSSPDSRNRFAVALYDPYVPDVVYGEVLIIPEWTQPTLSAEVIRQNNGVSPSPEPILPTRFTIQLYNPDQQVIVHYKPKSWNSPPSWSFEMPQHSFRVPTGSTLDRIQIDPAAADTTPKLRFIWRKDGKLSKDLTCLLRGKTTAIPETKTKSKEPDITVSIFKGLRELTMYEPNLYRVEMEDFKGLEVVLMLGAIAIRDVYFASPKEAFRISRQNSASVSPTCNPPITNPPTNRLRASPSGLVTDIPPAPQHPRVRSPQITKQQEQSRKEEEKARWRRQAEVDKETRRLQKLYGEEERKARMQTPSLPPRQPVRPQYNQVRPPMPHEVSQPGTNRGEAAAAEQAE
ncbi:hypothetical protein BDW66DRAFT_164408 [Aspergillus desertorum]